MVTPSINESELSAESSSKQQKMAKNANVAKDSDTGRRYSGTFHAFGYIPDLYIDLRSSGMFPLHASYTHPSSFCTYKIH